MKLEQRTDLPNNTAQYFATNEATGDRWMVTNYGELLNQKNRVDSSFLGWEATKFKLGRDAVQINSTVRADTWESLEPKLV